MLIPKDLKTNAEIGLYLAVYVLNIRSPNELMNIFRYQHKRSLDRALAHVRQSMKSHLQVNNSVSFCL